MKLFKIKEAYPASGDKSEIFLPALHFKFIWIKMSVTAMDKERERFAYLRKIIPKVSEAKIGIFFGPHITQLFDDQYFSTKLTSTEIRA
jgi:hypothetical protein